MGWRCQVATLRVGSLSAFVSGRSLLLIFSTIPYQPHLTHFKDNTLLLLLPTFVFCASWSPRHPLVSYRRREGACFCITSISAAPFLSPSTSDFNLLDCWTVDCIHWVAFYFTRLDVAWHWACPLPPFPHSFVTFRLLSQSSNPIENGSLALLRCCQIGHSVHRDV